MKVEAEKFLREAHRCASRADRMLTIQLNDDAGRAAYMACFHAAQCFIFEKTSKVAKTHKGVRTEFVRLTKDDQRLDPALKRFLFQSYDFKSAADYSTSGEDLLSAQEAIAAVATAKAFVEHVMALL